MTGRPPSGSKRAVAQLDIDGQDRGCDLWSCRLRPTYSMRLAWMSPAVIAARSSFSLVSARSAKK